MRSNGHFMAGASHAFTWDDITVKHPAYAEDEGIHWAAHTLAHATEADPEAEGAYDDPTYHLKRVPLGKVRAAPQEPGDPRVLRAERGYREGVSMPPPVFVHRAGEYEVADGHHRVVAARRAGLTHLDAYVTKSPHTTPFPEMSY